MADTYWHKQPKDKPLFEDLLWSRPENRLRSGKLLIIGGNMHAFAAPAAAFTAANAAGAGTVKVLLPDKLRKTLGGSFAEAEFAPSTPSGSFSRKALLDVLELAEWSDGVLLVGDFGRNSETAIFLEKLMDKYKAQVTVAQDATDYFWGANSPMLLRSDTTSVINLGKLQKLAKANRPATPVLHNMALKDLVELLRDWTTGNRGNIVTKHADHLIAASAGQVSTTPYSDDLKWQVELAAYTSVWQIWQPQKTFEAITSAVYSYGL